MSKTYAERPQNLNGFAMVSTRVEPSRMEVRAFTCPSEDRNRGESPAVLDVKPAIEDVDAQIFLAFHCA